MQTDGPVSGPFLCRASSFVFVCSRRVLGLGPDQTESFPLLAVRKPVPMVACRDDVEGGGGVGRRKIDASPGPAPLPRSVALLIVLFFPRMQSI